MAVRVEQVTVYDQVDALDPDPAVLDALRRGEIGYVTLPSSNIARALLGCSTTRSADGSSAAIFELVAISPETGRAIRELGYPVAAEAEVFTEDGLIEAVVRLVRSEARP